jgi:hypothetical protein
MISHFQGAIYVERFILRLIQYYLLFIETVEPKIKLDQRTKFQDGISAISKMQQWQALTKFMVRSASTRLRYLNNLFWLVDLAMSL